jgi:ubiquinone/menaquinone biosynthesis C-methylase UbiE
LRLQHTYTLIAPFYDTAIDHATRAARQRSLAALPDIPARVLLTGIGTGLDLPHLPPQHQYTGLDLNPAMLRRAIARAGHLDFVPLIGDAQQMPLADASFDAAVLHLILAVVPDPPACLREIARLLKPGGKVLVFDKFLRPGQSAPVRRLLNPLMRRLATRLDVVFEETLRAAPDLSLVADQPAIAGGWFRLIQLRRDD